MLTQPAEDRWSPLELSQPVLSRITRVPVDTVMLSNAGHYPIEEPGLQQMHDAIAEFITRNSVTSCKRGLMVDWHNTIRDLIRRRDQVVGGGAYCRIGGGSDEGAQERLLLAIARARDAVDSTGQRGATPCEPH